MWTGSVDLPVIACASLECSVVQSWSVVALCGCHVCGPPTKSKISCSGSRSRSRFQAQALELSSLFLALRQASSPLSRSQKPNVRVCLAGALFLPAFVGVGSMGRTEGEGTFTRLEKDTDALSNSNGMFSS